jgi:pimeloyl-ACP methyl ester carboxylesterase
LSAREGIDVAASRTQLRTAGPLPAIPALVIARGERAGLPTSPEAMAERLWRELQHDLADRLPDAGFVVAAKSGHTIPADQPELVATQIRHLVELVRRAIPA